MKNLINLLAVILFAITFAQAPQKMSFQAVLRDNANVPIPSKEVSLKISILKSSSNGAAVYIETQNATTNSMGLVSLQIGTGTPVSGSFSSISWGSGDFYVKTEAAVGAGNPYSLVSTTQLLSVPYALYANSASTLASSTSDSGTITYSFEGGAELPVTSIYQKSTNTVTTSGGTSAIGKPNVGEFIFNLANDVNTIALMKKFYQGSHSTVIEFKFYKTGSTTPYYSIKLSDSVILLNADNQYNNIDGLTKTFSIYPTSIGYKDWVNNTMLTYNIGTSLITSTY